MGIIGLTDKGSSFPRIGELRKGAEKPATGNRPGADLKVFRFTSKNKNVEDWFNLAYPTGNDINVFFPFSTTDENFQAWQEEWGAGSLKHRCDGKHVVIIQQGGRYVHPEPNTMPCPGGCKQVGRLKVIIPELARLAYVVALTTSIHDIIEAHSNLAAYEALRGDLRGIPFILSRVPRMISTPSGKGGKRVRREKWLWHIEAAPDWVQAQLSVMQQSALPNPQLAIAANSIDTNTGEIIDITPVEQIVDETGYPLELAMSEPGAIKDVIDANPSVVAEIVAAIPGNIFPPDEQTVFATPSYEFIKCCMELIPRYKHPKAVENALKKIGFTGISTTPEKRLAQYQALKNHAQKRDALEQAQGELFPDAPQAESGAGAFDS